MVAELRGDLVRRDAELMLLVDPVKADRALLDGSSAVSLFPKLAASAPTGRWISAGSLPSNDVQRIGHG